MQQSASALHEEPTSAQVEAWAQTAAQARAPTAATTATICGLLARCTVRDARRRRRTDPCSRRACIHPCSNPRSRRTVRRAAGRRRGQDRSVRSSRSRSNTACRRPWCSLPRSHGRAPPRPLRIFRQCTTTNSTRTRRCSPCRSCDHAVGAQAPASHESEQQSRPEHIAAPSARQSAVHARFVVPGTGSQRPEQQSAGVAHALADGAHDEWGKHVPPSQRLEQQSPVVAHAHRVGAQARASLSR